MDEISHTERRTWRMIGWLLPPLVLACGLLLWLPYRAKMACEQTQQVIDRANDFRRVCARQVQEQGGLVGKLDETSSASFAVAPTAYL